MQRLPKKQDSDITQDELDFAIMLIQYFRHSFDVRAVDVIPIPLDPPEVRELLNLVMWLGNGFPMLDAGYHLQGLHEIIQTSAIEMREMLEYIRSNGADRQVVQDVNFLRDQMESADTLMGYLTNG